MNWIRSIGGLIFGRRSSSGQTAIAEIAEVFVPNAENQAARDAAYNHAAISQYAAEFHNRNNRTWFDSLVDGMNRLIRPVMAIACMWAIIGAVFLPEQMQAAYIALATIPNGMWALISLVFGFYFGGRMQIKAQDFRQNETVAAAVATAAAASIASPPSGERDYSALAGEMD